MYDQEPTNVTNMHVDNAEPARDHARPARVHMPERAHDVEHARAAHAATIRALFNALCLPLHAELLGYARRLCDGNAAFADDIIQASYLRAFEAFSTWDPGNDPEGAAKGWLYLIVRNVFLNECERNERAVRHLNKNDVRDVFHNRETEVADPFTVIAQKESIAYELSNAVASLQPEQRVVVELVLIQGILPRVAAKILGCPQGSVLSRLSRARALLRVKLAKFARAEYGLGMLLRDTGDTNDTTVAH